MPAVYSALQTSGAMTFLDLRKMFGGPSATGAGGGGIRVYDKPGCYVFVVPNTTNTVNLLVVGGGGAGGPGSCTYFVPGGSGGGGGGGYVATATPTVTPGSSLLIHVGSGGLTGTGCQGASGDNSTVRVCGGAILLTAPGGYGGYKTGIGGSSGGSTYAGGNRISNITSSTTSTQSHSAGGGGGAGGPGSGGFGSWAVCSSQTAGTGGTGLALTFQGQNFKPGGGGGGGAPFVKAGLSFGAAGSGNQGVGGAVAATGHEGTDGFGGGGGGGGAGGILIAPCTSTNIVGYICGPNLYVQGIKGGLDLKVGAKLQFTPGIYGKVQTGTVVTTWVRGTGTVGGCVTDGQLNIATYNTSTAYGHFRVTPSQFAYQYNSTSSWYSNIQITGYYNGLCQVQYRGAVISSGSGGRGGHGGVYVYASDACSGPVPIGCYYRGGCYVPNAPDNSKIPVSGAIRVPCDFYGARGTYVYYYCLPNGQYDTNFNLLARALAACPPYPNSGVPLQAYITISGVLGATAPSGPAFDTGCGWSRTPRICLQINQTGVITGAGAAAGGSDYCYNHYVGGDAMWLRHETCITNRGIIQGGGGGGRPAEIFGMAGGAGYYPGASQTAGTLFSGGAYTSGTYPSGKKNKSSRTIYGGGGGGWVSCANRSPSVDGWGYNQFYGCGRAGPPGNAIINKSVYARFNAPACGIAGTVRGICTQ
jgi:hypothetical protein